MDNSTGTVRKNDQETNFIGMDLHLDNVVVVVAQNEIKDNTVRSKTVLSKKFKTVGQPNIDELFKVLETYCQDKPHMAVVESTYNWYWLADEFEKRNWNLRLADPSTVSKAGFKYSDDYTDASYLADQERFDQKHGDHAQGRPSGPRPCSLSYDPCRRPRTPEDDSGQHDGQPPVDQAERRQAAQGD